VKYLLDTNICVLVIRQKSPAMLQRLAGFAVDDIGVPMITVAELQYGAEKSQRPEQNRRALEQFLLPLALVEFDYAAAIAYGRIRAELAVRGQTIGALDMLIAAQALSLDVPLVTNNTQEFARVPGLRIEDWTTSS
jgi:tRNA(fMet)-specific endonuclease VapC